MTSTPVTDVVFDVPFWATVTVSPRSKATEAGPKAPLELVANVPAALPSTVMPTVEPGSQPVRQTGSANRST